MIIVEIPVKSIERELEAIRGINTGSHTRMYQLGVTAALKWMKDGTTKPSDLQAALNDPRITA